MDTIAMIALGSFGLLYAALVVVLYLEATR